MVQPTPVTASPPRGRAPQLPRWASKWTLVALVALGVVVYLWPNVFIPIHPGEGGVVWHRFGDGTDLASSRGEGTAIIAPWNKVYVYDLTVQERRVRAPAYTADGMAVEVILSARFHADRDELPRLHREVGPEYFRKIVEPEIIHSLRTLVGSCTSGEINTLRVAELISRVRADAESRIERYELGLDELLLVKLSMPEQVQLAVQRKLEAEQDALAHEHEKRGRLVEAQGVAGFEEVSGVSAERWRALDVSSELARSTNAKVVVLGNDAGSLQLLRPLEDSLLLTEPDGEGHRASAPTP